MRELSADVRAVAVLDGAGRTLAGAPGLGAAAPPLLAAARAGEPAVVVRTASGVVFVARGPGRAMIAAAGPLSLEGPTALDVRAAVLALEAGEAGPADPAEPGPAPDGPRIAALAADRTALRLAAEAALRAV